LNKINLFAEKLPRSPVGDYFPDYTGGNNYDAACDYLLHRFVSLNQSAATKQIYAHYSRHRQKAFSHLSHPTHPHIVNLLTLRIPFLPVACRPTVTPTTTSVSVSKVVANTRSQTNQDAPLKHWTSIPGPVDSSTSASATRNTDQALSFIVPCLTKNEDDSSASSSSGSRVLVAVVTVHSRTTLLLQMAASQITLVMNILVTGTYSRDI
jgi:hypothetical protein